MKQRKIFIDMDGVLVDFESHAVNLGFKLGNDDFTDEWFMDHPNFFREMPPMPDAIASVAKIQQMGFDVWVASKPPPSVPHSYAEKVDWIKEYLPDLQKKIILTQDKGILGSYRDFLVDDRIHKANCSNFPGKIIHFGSQFYPNWSAVLEHLSLVYPQI